jgi:multidrug efflux pump subunit AcrB
MTTLATASGLSPLAYGSGAGAKVHRPLVALAVIGGLALL